MVGFKGQANRNDQREIKMFIYRLQTWLWDVIFLAIYYQFLAHWHSWNWGVVIYGPQFQTTPQQAHISINTPYMDNLYLYISVYVSVYIYICICICIYIYTNSASCGAVDVRHVYRALHGTWLWGVIYIYLYMPRNLYTPRNGTLYVGLKSVLNPIIIRSLE